MTNTENTSHKTNLFKATALALVAGTAVLTAGSGLVNADTYTVKAGDTLTHIAGQYNTSAQALASANHRDVNGTIYVGEHLETAGKADTAQPAKPAQSAKVDQSATTYTVQAGDTLSKIASAHGTGLSNLLALNPNIQVTDTIYVGQSIRVKGSAPIQHTPDKVATPVQQQAPIQHTPDKVATPVQQQAPVKVATPVKQATPKPATVSNQGGNSARDFIAQRESGGSYTATNGQYIGKYQLSRSYLNGDYSPANQERVANNYATSRYGSWEQAQQFWQVNGWW